MLALEQLAPDLIVRAIAQPQQDRRIDGMRDDHRPDPGHPAQPCQIHAPRTVNVLDHLTDEPADILARRRVVQQHAILDKGVVGLRNPSRVVLVQMHLEDVDIHLVCDDEEGNEEKCAEA